MSNERKNGFLRTRYMARFWWGPLQIDAWRHGPIDKQRAWTIALNTKFYICIGWN